mmetsp:Transcript_74901/g.199685  ORF Transcript_74901/g.199685 Transcript_74901/m.199685 type:complete len:370 (-) Transcript_74901:355-1464(-)
MSAEHLLVRCPIPGLHHSQLPQHTILHKRAGLHHLVETNEVRLQSFDTETQIVPILLGPGHVPLLAFQALDDRHKLAKHRTTSHQLRRSHKKRRLSNAIRISPGARSQRTLSSASRSRSITCHHGHSCGVDDSNLVFPLELERRSIHASVPEVVQEYRCTIPGVEGVVQHTEASLTPHPAHPQHREFQLKLEIGKAQSIAGDPCGGGRGFLLVDAIHAGTATAPRSSSDTQGVPQVHDPLRGLVRAHITHSVAFVCSPNHVTLELKKPSQWRGVTAAAEARAHASKNRKENDHTYDGTTGSADSNPKGSHTVGWLIAPTSGPKSHNQCSQHCRLNTIHHLCSQRLNSNMQSQMNCRAPAERHGVQLRML